MKVLLISPVPPPTGGITRWSETVLNAISRRKDIELTHIDISPRYRGGITLIKRVFFGVFGLFGIMRHISKELKAKPDVIHLTTSGGLALFRDNVIAKKAVKRGVPLVLHLHYGRVPETFSQNNRECKLLKRALNAAAKVIAIDDETFSALSDNGFAEKSFFCPNPITVDEISKKQTPYASRENKVVFLGHILKTKGIEELLTAWQSLKEEFPGYELEIIGAPYEDGYIERLPHDGSIRFVGQKDHDSAMDMLSRAKVFILPSYTEGFPYVILEAMALSVPIVATDVGAIPSMLSGGCGVVIKPKSDEAIKNSLRELLTDGNGADAMAKKAYARVCEEYDCTKVINKYFAVWEKAVSKDN